VSEMERAADTDEHVPYVPPQPEHTLPPSAPPGDVKA
jgi:hypothetical protein